MLSRAFVRGAAVALATAAGVVAPAHAAQLMVSDSYTGLTNFDQTLQLAQFNPALGTLTGVTVEVNSSFSGHFFVENTSAGAGGWKINSLDWAWTVDALSQTLISVSDTLSEPLTTLDPFDGTLDFDGPSGDTFPYADSMSFNHAYNAGDSEFADFIGAGTVDFEMAISIFTSHTVYGGSAASGFSTSGAFDVTITYDYSAIPAPGAAAGLGVLGLGAARRRRRYA